jgi:L-lactate dehydrogenase (cytochrome)
LPAIRAKLGPGALIMADGGIRSGLDIARMLALGADYVFLGRPFIYATSIGDAGPSHLISVLKEELSGTMAQIGCSKISDLSRFLHRP